MNRITIVGMGLAGSCLAWELWRRQISFRIVDDNIPGSSHVAAGLVNPVTGKNCAVSWRYREFFGVAEQFYRNIETRLDCQLWFPLEVIRLIAAQNEKMSVKLLHGDAAEWVIDEQESHPWPGHKAYVLRGAARVDTAAFVRKSRDFFAGLGYVTTARHQAVAGETTVWCEGAAGLLRANPLPWQHRCAKGEILTVHAPAWRQERMVIGRGWLVPLGDDFYKVGATYDWDTLDANPTTRGRELLESITRDIGGPEFRVIAHEAGIRPIIRKSQPVIGPLADGAVVFNGLGSKGALCAPMGANRLADWLVDGREIEADLSTQAYFADLTKS